MPLQIPSRKASYQAKKVFAGKKQLDQEAKAEALLLVVNDSARHVRHVFIGFFLLAIYIAVIVWSTTDEMLLRLSPIALPLFNLQLPIKGFYTFFPYLFLLIYFNLLLQLHFLSKKCNQFNQQLNGLSVEQKEYFRIRLLPSTFVQLLSANQTRKWGQGLLLLMMWLFIIVFPLLVLIQLQLGFLPFHDSAVLLGQRIAIVIALAFILVFLPMMNKQGTHYAVRIGQEVTLFCLGSFILIFSWGLATIPGEAKQNLWTRWIPPSFWSEEKGDELKLTTSLFDQEDSIFHRNLWLPEKLFIQDQLIPHPHHKPDDIKSVNLSNRDLRWINLSNTLLVNANFKGAELQNAYLLGANLQGADLKLTNLQGAYLFGADLQGADLRFANLQGANLNNANLQGADLRLANLQGASLGKANLQGANLQFANLQGVDLEGAGLQGAKFDHVNLQGADLRFSNLRATEFMSTDFSLVNFEDIVVGRFREKAYRHLENKLSETFLNQKKLEKITQKLHNKIGKNIQIDSASKGSDILVNTSIRLEYYSKKLKYAKSEQEYLSKLSRFLTELACSDKFIAQGVILHRVDNKANDWSSAGATCLAEKMIAETLLARKNDTSRQCIGLTDLSGYLVDKLKKSVGNACQ